MMTIDQKLKILEQAKREGATDNEIERMIAIFWENGNVPVEVYAIRTDQTQPSLNLEQIVSDLLYDLSIPAHIKGYYYIRSAIIECIKDVSITNGITKNLYPRIANKYNTKPDRVERAIRHAIEIAMKSCDVEILKKYFKCNTEDNRVKATNRKFIVTLVDRLKLQYNL